MLKTKRIASGEYKVSFEGATYSIYQDSDGWVAVDGKGSMKAESSTKSDLLDKLDDLLRFG